MIWIFGVNNQLVETSDVEMGHSTASCLVICRFAFALMLMESVLQGAKQNSRFPGTGMPIEVKRTVAMLIIFPWHERGKLYHGK